MVLIESCIITHAVIVRNRELTRINFQEIETMQNDQNAFQNAGQNGSFNYTEIGNQSSTFLVLILALILLVALLRSEQRNRELVQRLGALLPPE